MLKQIIIAGFSTFSYVVPKIPFPFILIWVNQKLTDVNFR